jgi:hypothetical protein
MARSFFPTLYDIKMMVGWKSIQTRFPFLRHISPFLRRTKILSPWRIDQAVEAEKVTDGSIENLRILWPAQAVSLEPTELDRTFLKVCRYFNDGFYPRRNIFTCEVPGAFVHVGSGLVCTRDFKAVIDSHYDRRRMMSNPHFGWFKPWRRQRLADSPPGAHYGVVVDTWQFNWHHWLSDNLTRIYSLSRAYPDHRIMLLTPSELRRDWKESLAAALPPRFELKALYDDTWVQVDRLLLPSFVSARGNYHLPPGYYDTMRKTSFDRLGFSDEAEPHERLYVPRPKTGIRRILNEDDLIQLLSRYGFRSVIPEKMPFRDQVDLYRRAEIVVGGYGANWGLNLYAGPIKNFVLYSDKSPETYVYTFSKALGQEHYFLAGEADDANADQTVDLAAVKRVLEDQMNLRACA